MTSPSKFDKVYYLVQTKPSLLISGHDFNLESVQEVQRKFLEYANTETQIVEFSRDELVELGY